MGTLTSHGLLTPPEQDPVMAIFTSHEFVQVALCLLSIYEIVHSVTCHTLY